MQQMAACSIDGAVHYHFMDWRHIGELLAAGRAVYGELLNMCVWAKTNAGHGLVLSQPARAGVRLQGRRPGRTSTMSGSGSTDAIAATSGAIAGMNSFGAERQEALALASHGQARAPGGRRDPGCLEARWPRSRSLRRLGHQPDRGRADRAAGAADRAGAEVCRRHHPALAAADRRGRGPWPRAGPASTRWRAMRRRRPRPIGRARRCCRERRAER